MRKEFFQAITSYSFQDNPIDYDKTLFVTGTDTVMNSVLMELLKKELARGKCQICLAISSYYALDQSFPDISGKENVRLLTHDSYEYIETLSEAGRIISALPLPNYFVKKECQRIYELISKAGLKEKNLASAEGRNAVRTDNNADYYIRDDLYKKLFFSSNGRGLAVLLPSVHYHPNKEIEMLREIKRITKNIKASYGVSSEAWDLLLRNNDEAELRQDVYPSTLSCKELLEQSDTIITENDSLAEIAERSGKKVFFCGMTDSRMSQKIIRTSDIFEAIEKYKGCSVERREDHRAAIDGDARDLAEISMEDFISNNAKELQNKVLIVSKWKERRGLIYIAQFLERNTNREQLDFDFLFTDIDKQELKSESEKFLSGVNVLIREGKYQCAGIDPSENKDEKTKEIFDFNTKDIRREWKRLVGEKEYEEIWISEDAGLPMTEMDKSGPGKTIRLLPTNQLCKQFAEFISDKGIDIKDFRFSEASEINVIEESEFYSLGEYDGKEYYISRKAVIEPYILVKHSKKYEKRIKKLISEEDKDAKGVIVINPDGVKLPIIADDRKVIEIPSAYAAAELIASSKLLIAAAGEPELILAEMMSVPAKTVS